jgi:hypothetical protein
VWQELSIADKAAIRKLALGYTFDVPQHVLRQLVTRGLVEQGPNPRLTEAGFKLHTSNPRRHAGGRRAKPSSAQKG